MDSCCLHVKENDYIRNYVSLRQCPTGMNIRKHDCYLCTYSYAFLVFLSFHSSFAINKIMNMIVQVASVSCSVGG